MINLLPPDLKEQVTFSRRNATLMRYLKVIIFTAIVLAGVLFGARYYLNRQISQTDAQIADKQVQLNHFKKLDSDAKKLNARLASIQKIQVGQAKFSLLLTDLAQYMPRGTAISSLTLTGDDKKPVRLIVDATDYKTALGFRDSIAKSKRISAADIEGVQSATDTTGHTTYKVTVTFVFSPGEAK